MRSLVFHSADFDTSDGQLNWMAFESKSSFDNVGPIRVLETEVEPLDKWLGKSIKFAFSQKSWSLTYKWEAKSTWIRLFLPERGSAGCRWICSCRFPSSTRRPWPPSSVPTSARSRAASSSRSAEWASPQLWKSRMKGYIWMQVNISCSIDACMPGACSLPSSSYDILHTNSSSTKNEENIALGAFHTQALKC